MLSFPFARLTSPVTVQTQDHREWWAKKSGYPISVELHQDIASVNLSLYRLAPLGDRTAPQGYVCLRPKEGQALGEIYEYGVRKSLTNKFFHELSAIRSVVWGSTNEEGRFVPKSCPAPLCYEMPNGDLVHPGPCFSAHNSSVIRRTRYTLTEDADTACSVCHERFV